MLRNARLFNITRRLCSQGLNQWRSMNPSSQSFKLFHGASGSSLYRPLPNSSSVIALGHEMAICKRYLSTTATVNSENPPAKSSADATSGKGEKSEQSNQSGDAGKPVRGGPVSWMSFFLLVCTGAGLVVYYDREKKRHIQGISNSSNSVKEGPSVGKAAIGGPFNLINHYGKPVTEKDFLGKWTIIYFGFTHCPDICPDELQKLTAAIDNIEKKGGIEVVPVFISVDPERDSVEQVAEYVKEFHPKLIGLTGSKEEVLNVARAYRVYYMKTAEEDSDYLVDHSIIMYLMDPDMEFLKYFGKNEDVDTLTNGVIKEIKGYKKKD